MKWILLVPLALAVACDKVRAPAKVESPVDPAPVVATARDTTPAAVAPALDSTATAMPDSTAIPAPDSAVAPKPDSVVVRRPEFAIPAKLANLPPAPESEPIEFDDVDHPILPHVNYGDCEGENCSGSFVAYSCLPTQLRTTTRRNAPIAARIPEGEFLQVRRDLHLRTPGVVVVKQDFQLDWDESEDDVAARADTVDFAEGDTVYVLRYLELGRWTWAYHGRLHDSGEFWTTTNRNGTKRMESTYAETHSLPRREQWWKVTRLDGTSGWWLQAVGGEKAQAENRDALQSVTSMQKWADDCTQVKARVSRGQSR